MTSFPGSLHHHTDYSNIRLRDAISTIDRSFDKAIELGHTCIAFTEHECVSNAVKVQEKYQEIKKSHPDFKAILGNEIYLCRDGLNKDNFDAQEDRYFHFILLAKNETGHRQIRELSTRAWLRSYMARGMRRVPTYYQDLIDIIVPNRGNVIGSTACLGGFVPTMLLKYRETNDQRRYDRVVKWLKSMVRLFGQGNFFLELQPSSGEEQIYVNKCLLDLSESLGIPYIITTDTHYISAEERDIHSAYLKSQNGDREVDSFYATTYMMGTEELESFFPYLSKDQLRQAYDNIRGIQDSCEDYDLKKPLKIPRLPWKQARTTEAQRKKYSKLVPNLQFFLSSKDEGDRLLGELLVERFAKDKTLQNDAAYAEFDFELDSIIQSSEVNNVHWSYYFLNLQKIIDTCWEAGTIVGCGRGSGVGFAILYALDIIQINPLRENVQTRAWRFLNPSRTSVLDIDTDISGLRREDVLKRLRDVYGQDRISNVLTFGTEKTKSAILTAARGLNIPVDTAQYIASLVPSDRGTIRTLDQCYYGDEDNGFKPVKDFVKAMKQNPDLWRVAKRIEGLVCRVGCHAGGIIFVDEPFTNSGALMKTPDGTVVTAFDLHDCEKLSEIKIDLLSVVAMDKIQTCLELLVKYGYVKEYPTLRETYEHAIGIYNLERQSKDMWKMIWEHKVQALFQWEKQSGIQAIELAHPTTVDEMAFLNALIRLQAQEKGAEQPLNKFQRFKDDEKAWDQEMKDYGLTAKERALLHEHLDISNGLCVAQEQFMTLVQLPQCGGYTLNWADKLRKQIAKKNPKGFDELEKEFFQNAADQQLHKEFCEYVWNVLIKMSKGYGFNLSHTLAYSLVALQEMNLAFKYPLIFWDTANLIVDAGVIENQEEGASADYSKIARAVNKIKTSSDTKISLVNINQSGKGFTPDVENNIVHFGLAGLQGLGSDIVNKIIENRPYENMEDFLAKVNINKANMVTLIKSGAFDDFGPREVMMEQYLRSVSSPKKRITMQNLAGLIDNGLWPETLDFQRRVFVYNKALKKQCRQGDHYLLKKKNFLSFYENFFDEDALKPFGAHLGVSEKDWKKQYDKAMKPAKEYIAANQETLLEQYNGMLFQELWDKYAQGSLAAWEMASLGFYYHDHEMLDIDNRLYDIVEYSCLGKEPEIAYVFSKGGRDIPIYNTVRIAGTVIAKDDMHSSISLLTPRSGVVTVKMPETFYARINRRISELGPDGTKTIKENGWTKRGTKCVLNGVRKGETFLLKTYKKTPYHKFYKVDQVLPSGKLKMHYNRYNETEEDFID